VSRSADRLTRFKPDPHPGAALEYHLGGRDISEVLAMSVTEAEEFFGADEARTPAAHACRPSNSRYSVALIPRRHATWPTVKPFRSRFVASRSESIVTCSVSLSPAARLLSRRG
jgi:hypothetical protein